MTTHNTDQSRLVVIKRYTTQDTVYLDADLLRNHGIECCVNGAIGATTLPYIQGQVSLLVSEMDAQEAVRIVPGEPRREEED